MALCVWECGRGVALGFGFRRRQREGGRSCRRDVQNLRLIMVLVVVSCVVAVNVSDTEPRQGKEAVESVLGARQMVLI